MNSAIRNALLEDAAYERDARTRDYGDGIVREDIEDISRRVIRMRATVYGEDDDWGTEREADIPAIVRVCHLCDGTGKVVNPSIDCNGLSADGFREDPDFLEDYGSGMYDIVCPRCGGRNVIAEPDMDCIHDWPLDAKEVYYAREAYLREKAETAACHRAERMMGA